MFDPMFIWVTRSSPYNLLTAHHLRAIGHSAMTVPVLRIGRVEQPPLGRRPDALVFTSAHAVRHHLFEAPLAWLPVFTVGDATAEAARRSGYHNVRSAAGDVSRLQKLIESSLLRPAHIVHYSAAQPAGDLTGRLAESGFGAERRVVYESIEASAADLEGATAVLPMLDAITVHSPKAARRVAPVLRGARWHGIVFCVSDACASEFAGLPGLLVETAAEPSQASLMTLVGQFRWRPGGRAGAVAAGAMPPALGPEPPLPWSLDVANDNGSSPSGDSPAGERGCAREGPDEPPPTAA